MQYYYSVRGGQQLPHVGSANSLGSWPKLPYILLTIWQKIRQKLRFTFAFHHKWDISAFNMSFCPCHYAVCTSPRTIVRRWYRSVAHAVCLGVPKRRFDARIGCMVLQTSSTLVSIWLWKNKPQNNLLIYSFSSACVILRSSLSNRGSRLNKPTTRPRACSQD